MVYEIVEVEEAWQLEKRKQNHSVDGKVPGIVANSVDDDISVDVGFVDQSQTRQETETGTPEMKTSTKGKGLQKVLVNMTDCLTKSLCQSSMGSNSFPTA